MRRSGPGIDDPSGNVACTSGRLRAANVRVVVAAVEALPVPQREVIHLLYYEGLSVSETAHVLAIAESTVQSRLRRARRALNDTLCASPASQT